MTKTKKIILIAFVLFALVLVSPAVLGEGQQGDGDGWNDPLPTFAPDAWEWNVETPTHSPDGDEAGVDIAGMNDQITVMFEAYYFDVDGNRIYVRGADGGYTPGRGTILDIPNPSSRISITAPYGIPSDEVYYRLFVSSSFTNGDLDASYAEGVNYCISADLNLPANLPPKSISDVYVEMTAVVSYAGGTGAGMGRYIDSYNVFFPTQVLHTTSWVELPGGGLLHFTSSSLYVTFKGDGNIFANAPSFTGSFSDYYEFTRETDESLLTRLFAFDSNELSEWLIGRNTDANACTRLLLGTFAQMEREYERDNADTIFSFDGFDLNIGGTNYGQVLPPFSISSGFDVVTVNGEETYTGELGNILSTVRRYVTYFLAIVFLYTYIKMYLRLFGVNSDRVVDSGGKS